MSMRELQNELQTMLRVLADNREAAQIDRDHARIELRAEAIHNRTVVLARLDAIEQQLDRIEQLIRDALGQTRSEDAY
jgi:hypothetical protein